MIAMLAVPLDSDAGEIGKGTLELGLAGGFERTSIEDEKLNSLDLQTRLTWSLTNRVAMGGTVAFAHLSSDSGGDATSMGLTADFILNFPTQSNVVPFGQVSLGVTTWGGDVYDDPELTFVLPFVGGGFRVLVGDHASVNVLAGYRHQSNAFGIKDLTAHDIVLSFGLSVFPGGIQD
jgi:hypothetical protein